MENEEKSYKKGYFISLGIALGVPLGLILGNIAYGIPIGLALGLLTGSTLEKKMNPHPTESEDGIGEVESRRAWIWVIPGLAALMIISAMYFIK
ncbi:MAG: hypothetical protein RIM99_18435 [Cyclobacteriaceae bacterium]